MKRYIVLLFLSWTLLGCGEKGPVDAMVVSAEPVSMTGKQAYESVCADCHENGLNGAPKTGDRDAWVGRSWLWEGVLFEHARAGYEGMPAKGGDESLNEVIVTKAAEYMMSLTYPDMPPG
jgi:cytochrome c5